MVREASDRIIREKADGITRETSDEAVNIVPV
jgi:hypothetical protein